MDSNLSDIIIQHVKGSFCWNQPLVYINPDENIIVNLAEVVGENAHQMKQTNLKNISKIPNFDCLDLC